MLKQLIPFFILATVKGLSHLFFRAHYTWIGDRPANPWASTKIIAIMNHTSLYEPIFIQAFSLRYLWFLTKHVNVPGADVTLNRPIVGRFWKLMIPGISSVSRKKDATWENYLSTINDKSVIMIAPEGRMKRPNGLDKFGKPMTVKGGIADILEDIQEGGMVLCFSGGLHHVQVPGQHFPNLFQDIRMNLVYLDIPTYKSQFPGSPRHRKIAIIADLQKRLTTQVPQ